MEIGPPLLKPAPKFVKQPARIEMIENEIAKLENSDQLRFSSCLYPRRSQVLLVLGQVRRDLVIRNGFVCFGHVTPSGVRGDDCLEARPARIRLGRSAEKIGMNPDH